MVQDIYHLHFILVQTRTCFKHYSPCWSHASAYLMLRATQCVAKIREVCPWAPANHCNILLPITHYIEIGIWSTSTRIYEIPVRPRKTICTTETDSVIGNIFFKMWIFFDWTGFYFFLKGLIPLPQISYLGRTHGWAVLLDCIIFFRCT